MVGFETCTVLSDTWGNGWAAELPITPAADARTRINDNSVVTNSLDFIGGSPVIDR
jgi:hypothetical protein